MSTRCPRRFEFAVAPSATGWIGDALRRVFVCPDSLPGSLGRLIERLQRAR